MCVFMSACLCVGLGLTDRLFVPGSIEIQILPQPHQVLSEVLSSEDGVRLCLDLFLALYLFTSCHFPLVLFIFCFHLSFGPIASLDYWILRLLLKLVPSQSSVSLLSCTAITHHLISLSLISPSAVRYSLPISSAGYVLSSTSHLHLRSPVCIAPPSYSMKWSCSPSGFVILLSFPVSVFCVLLNHLSRTRRIHDCNKPTTLKHLLPLFVSLLALVLLFSHYAVHSQYS